MHLLSRFCYFVFLLTDFPYFYLQEVTSSQAMEKEAFIRCINNIHHSQNLPIKMLSTDRHVSIKTWMNTDERFKHIKHQFDLWHVAKGILKKIMQSAATRGTHYISAPYHFYARRWQKAMHAQTNLYLKTFVETFIAFYYNQALKDWHIFNCRLMAVVGTSRNINFAVRMIFIFYSETVRRILKFPFSSKVTFSILFMLKN